MSELAATACERSTTETASPALRDEILTGAFFGHRFAAAAERSAAFAVAAGRCACRVVRPEPQRHPSPRTLRPAAARSTATSPRSMRCCRRTARCHPAPPAPAAASKGAGAASPGWRTASIRRARGSRCKVLHARLGRIVPRPGTRRRVRPEPAVPQDLRGRIRHARRRAVRPAGGRPRGPPPPEPPRRRTDDVNALTALAGVAAAAFCADRAGRLAGAAGGGQISPIWQWSTELTAPLRNTDYTRWRSLSSARGHALRRHRPAAHAGPPALGGRPGTRADGFRYAEYAPRAPDGRVWMSAGYAFAAVVARAFANYAWPADVRGVRYRPRRRRAGDRFAARAVPHRSAIMSGCDRPSISCSPTDRRSAR